MAINLRAAWVIWATMSYSVMENPISKQQKRLIIMIMIIIVSNSCAGARAGEMAQ